MEDIQYGARTDSAAQGTRRRKMGGGLLALVALAAGTTTGCSDEGPGSSSPPNVLLVTFDTTRWDHTGFGGGKANATPNLDSEAAAGTVFETCLTSQPMTLPSHTTIMTGLYPQRHGVRNNGSYVVGDENLTLAERLSDQGYDTHAVISAFVLDSQFGLDQGFASYDDELNSGPAQKTFMFKETTASSTTDRARAWLSESWDRDKPFFLWVHYFDPHANYEPPADIAAKFPDDPYTGEIHYADRELGRLFDDLKEWNERDNTLLVFTSDHGDGLGEHGEKNHGMFVYESTTRVPLLMSGPGVPGGLRVGGVTRTADIVPTLLDVLDIGYTGALDGQSLRSLWEGTSDDREAYMETFVTRQNFGWSEVRALRSKQHKVIESPKRERYNLESDPEERRNLLGSPAGDSEPLEQMAQRLSALAGADPFEEGAQRPDEVDPETRKKLEALGYVWSDDVDPDPSEALADPKDRVPYWNLFFGAQNLIRAGRVDEAAVAIEKLLAEDPDNSQAKSALAFALIEMDRPGDAIEVYLDLIARGAKNDTPYLGAARLLRESKRFEEARALTETLVELQPENPDGYGAMAEAFFGERNLAEAEKWFRRSVEVAPDYSAGWSGLGTCLIAAKKLDEAASVLEGAMQRDPANHALVFNLAGVKNQQGDAEAARELYHKALELDPGHSMTLSNLATIELKAGQTELALDLTLKAYELDNDNIEATFNLGAMLTSAGRPDEAIPYIEKVLTARPGLVQAAQLLVRAYSAAGRVGQARNMLKQLAPQHPPSWLDLARLELAAGQTEAARAALQSGIQVGGEAIRSRAAQDPNLAALLSD